MAQLCWASGGGIRRWRGKGTREQSIKEVQQTEREEAKEFVSLKKGEFEIRKSRKWKNADIWLM